jgi:leucyl-tRNA synthetase
VVTSVPSDSPDDYQTLTDLRKKPEYYKIEASWASFDPVPVIHTPAYGDLTAETIVKQLKIQSQKDTLRLAEAKDLAYKEGFYNGTMIVGEFKGLSVQEAKPKVRARMIEEGLAFAYAEPEGLVISRSGDECVVALMDQWYLDYGEPSWKAQAEKYVGVKPRIPDMRIDFIYTGSSGRWKLTATEPGMRSKVPLTGLINGLVRGALA